MVLGMFVLCSFCMSLCRCTVSKALLISSAVPIVRCGGLFALNPVVIMLLMWCSAVVVDLCCLKPCWCSGSVILLVMCGSMSFSSVLAIGERSAMGLYDVPIEVSLCGLGMGMTLASFQVLGMMFVLSVVL